MFISVTHCVGTIFSQVHLNMTSSGIPTKNGVDEIKEEPDHVIVRKALVKAGREGPDQVRYFYNKLAREYDEVKQEIGNIDSITQLIKMMANL